MVKAACKAQKREIQSRSNVVKFIRQKAETKAARKARIARIAAILDDPCRGRDWVRFAKIA
jgi:hypothetical protein